MPQVRQHGVDFSARRVGLGGTAITHENPCAEKSPPRSRKGKGGRRDSVPPLPPLPQFNRRRFSSRRMQARKCFTPLPLRGQPRQGGVRALLRRRRDAALANAPPPAAAFSRQALRLSSCRKSLPGRRSCRR